MELPLLERATENGELFVLTPAEQPAEASPACSKLMPGRVPLPGEQYRFHLDMSSCIGCKCCVVACNEQNGNPADMQWRRVGEIEGGSYPDAMRLYLSMGCNHCLEPTCMTGCPVDAYIKDSATGIVLHNAERCIGCQYCTWNCSYGVPQYNPERGVVGKCDMCYNRVLDGREPACVAACPEEAIRIEIVNKSEWRSDYTEHANAPGLPSADDSISTTRVTVTHKIPRDTDRVDTARVEPEHPHWPLVFMTVLTQMTVGAIAAMGGEQMLSHTLVSRWAAAGVVPIAMIALAASTLHLGRPIYAFRALSMWRRSWLSREVLLFSLFAAAATGYAGLLWFGSGASKGAGIVAALIGVAAVYASARLYLVPARPAWNSPFTICEFYLTAAFTGTLLAANFSRAGNSMLLHVAFAAAALAAIEQLAKIVWLLRSRKFELRASGEMLFHSPFFFPSAARFCGLIAVALGLALIHGARWMPPVALVVALGIEFVGRYLFFVSVVPKNMAAPYLRQGRAA